MGSKGFGAAVIASFVFASAPGHAVPPAPGAQPTGPIQPMPLPVAVENPCLAQSPADVVAVRDGKSPSLISPSVIGVPSYASKTNGCKRWVVDVKLEALAGANTLSLLWDEPVTKPADKDRCNAFQYSGWVYMQKPGDAALTFYAGGTFKGEWITDPQQGGPFCRMQKAPGYKDFPAPGGFSRPASGFTLLRVVTSGHEGAMPVPMKVILG